jgi:ribonuclease G
MSAANQPFTSKMLVEENRHECRVAVLEDDRVVELYLERPGQTGVVGGLYKGRVHRVLPGMQAAFVDIGLERHAFLYVSDVLERGEDLDEVELLEGGGEANEQAAGEPAPIPSISDLLRAGEELLVQVVKDPVPSKGARVTTRITLPGRYLVYVPNGSHRGVSRRIASPEERARLKEILLRIPFPGGFIVRTAGEAEVEEAFRRDAEMLTRRWQALHERAEGCAAPSLVQAEMDLVLRVVRDLFGPDFTGLWVDGEQAHRRIVGFLQEVQPALLSKVHLASGEGLFESHGVETAIEEALRPRVWLRSGGYLVVNPTEALVAIDVNTGRFVGRTDQEETILQTNLEAIREIVRQVRLRNLGGILVLDLIDMAIPEHREKVFAALEEELRRDRAKHRVLSISEFGLVELTRKQSRPSLERLLTRPCPHCDGRGRVKSPAAVALELRRRVLREVVAPGPTGVVLEVHPDVASHLEGVEPSILDELVEVLGVPVRLAADPSLHVERFEVLEG